MSGHEPQCQQKKGWKSCEVALCGHYIKPSVTAAVQHFPYKC